MLQNRKWRNWIYLSQTVNIFEIGWTIIDKTLPQQDTHIETFMRFTTDCWKYPVTLVPGEKRKDLSAMSWKILKQLAQAVCDKMPPPPKKLFVMVAANSNNSVIQNAYASVSINKKPTNWWDQAKLHANQLGNLQTFCVISGRIITLLNGSVLCSIHSQPEVAFDVISGVTVEQVGMDVHLKFGDYRSNRSRVKSDGSLCDGRTTTIDEAVMYS